MYAAATFGRHGASGRLRTSSNHNPASWAGAALDELIVARADAPQPPFSPIRLSRFCLFSKNGARPDRRRFIHVAIQILPRRYENLHPAMQLVQSNFRSHAGCFDALDGAGLILIRRAAANTDGADDLTAIHDQHAAGDRNHFAAGHVRQRS